MIVYKATNKIDGKCYVGQTKRTIEIRIKEHEKQCKNYLFYRAIEKHGIENFEWEILCECETREELNEKEKYYIKLLNSNSNGEFGYNLTKGGEWVLMSEETKEKIRKTRKERIGYKLSEEHKKNIGKSGIGRVVSEETREKIRKKLKGQKHTESRTLKIIEKISKPIFQYDLNGIFIKEWKSAKEASKFGFGQKYVISCCNNKKESYKKFKWQYKCNGL